MQSRVDATVVGGGFFGAYLAVLLRGRGLRTLLLERENQLMGRASYRNQARVHHGYHYPRSLMTAVRSRANYRRFLEDFTGAIYRGFTKYYAVASVMSKVTAAQFETFMARVGAPLEKAPPSICGLFTPRMVEGVWKVDEVAFSAGRLRDLMTERLRVAGVEVQLGSEVKRLYQEDEGNWSLQVAKRDRIEQVRTKWVFNCTYSGLNRLRELAGLEPLILKHEVTEMALVEPPPSLHGVSVTVMCGPFFSLMPFPDLGRWTLSHVRYTPHGWWTEGPGQGTRDGEGILEKVAKQSRGMLMLRDAARYLPGLGEARLAESSLWEIKTLLPQSELDDGRPILFHWDKEVPHFISVMGGKLDNVYDLAGELDGLGF